MVSRVYDGLKAKLETDRERLAEEICQLGSRGDERPGEWFEHFALPSERLAVLTLDFLVVDHRIPAQFAGLGGARTGAKRRRLCSMAARSATAGR